MTALVLPLNPKLYQIFVSSSFISSVFYCILSVLFKFYLFSSISHLLPFLSIKILPAFHFHRSCLFFKQYRKLLLNVNAIIAMLNFVRFGKLLLALPRLISFDGKSIETLFFKKTVGNIPVDKIVSDLFQGS